jgi:hypothetical protein
VDKDCGQPALAADMAEPDLAPDVLSSSFGTRI